MAAVPSADVPDQLVLVSSLYGPGTVACWYLTALSLLISWTLHPQKRRSGSIDVDLLAVLTLAVVSAGHLISQVPKLLARLGTNQNSSDTDLLDLQLMAAFEAPLTVVETFVMLSVILFLVAAWMGCIRRAIAVAVVGLGCFAVGYYVHFIQDMGTWYRHRSSGNDQPPFDILADFRSYLAMIFVPLMTYLLSTLTIPVYLLLSSLHSTPCATCTPETEESPIRQHPHTRHKAIDSSRHPYKRWIIMITILLLLSTSVASVLYVLLNSVQHHRVISAQSSSQTLIEFTAHIGREFLPKTNCTIADLDQAVAMAAGLTVLVFSIYSVVKHRYMGWKPGQAPVAPASIALNELRPTIEP